jgi:hypothetical protein
MTFLQISTPSSGFVLQDEGSKDGLLKPTRRGRILQKGHFSLPGPILPTRSMWQRRKMRARKTWKMLPRLSGPRLHLKIHSKGSNFAERGFQSCDHFSP